MTDHQPHMHEDYDYLRDVFTHHPPKSQAQIEKFEAIREGGYVLSDLFRTMVPNSREAEKAIDHIRTAVMWANAGLAIHGADVEDVPDEVIHFFGKMSPEDARRMKDEWRDRKAYDDRVAESPAPRTFDPSTPEGRPEQNVLTGGVWAHDNENPIDHVRNHPEIHEAWADENAQVAQIAEERLMEGVELAPIPEDMRIGTLQFKNVDGVKTCVDCVTGQVVETDDHVFVCTLCGRTVQMVPDRAPAACPECGMTGPHTHIDDRTFLDDGREIRVLTGLGDLMAHHGVSDGAPYVVLDEIPMEEPEPQPVPTMSAQGVSKLVSDFLERNPNALVEPVTRFGGVVKKAFTPKTVAEEQSGAPDHNHGTTDECDSNCPNQQWWRNR